MFTDAEGMQMMEKLEIFKQEQETWENLLHHEGINVLCFFCFKYNFELTDYEQIFCL